MTLRVLMEGLHGSSSYDSALSNLGRVDLTFVSAGVSKKAFRKISSQPLDLIVFTGGADINPKRYARVNVASNFNDQRDQTCFKIFQRWRGAVPMVGICRGLQFLWVATGGKMIQNLVPGHNASHHIRLATGWEPAGREHYHESQRRIIPVNSMHHQALELDGGIPEGWDIIGAHEDDGVVEAAINISERIGGVQYHPECLAGDSDGRALFDRLTLHLLGR